VLSLLNTNLIAEALCAVVRSLLGCQTTSKELRAAGGRKVTNIEGKCSVEYFLDKTVATT